MFEPDWHTDYAPRFRHLVGKRIRIVAMMDEPRYNGGEGVVERVDSRGQLHGTWSGPAV